MKIIGDDLMQQELTLRCRLGKSFGVILVLLQTNMNRFDAGRIVDLFS